MYWLHSSPPHINKQGRILPPQGEKKEYERAKRGVVLPMLQTGCGGGDQFQQRRYKSTGFPTDILMAVS
jgi:hypothetical protein